MIEINLVPAESRKKKKKSLLPGGFNIPLEVVIGIGGGLVMLLVCIDIFLVVFNVSKIGEHKKLKAEWEQILPAKENVDQVMNQMRDYQAKVKSIEDLTTLNQIIWAEKLNILSDQIPRGVWLKKVAISDGMFFVSGSAISRQKKEMISVHTFTANLKDSDRFLNGFKDFELGSIERGNVSDTDVADFLITIKIK